MAGRGFGKTKAGAETVREWVNEGARRIALIGPTTDDVRKTMVTGASTGPTDGLLNYFPPHQRPVYEPSKRMIRFHTGAVGLLYSSEEPGRLRGPQHDKAWADELREWKYPDECWSNLDFGLRTAEHPQTVVTTTPKPFKLLKELLASKTTIVTGGGTMENRANLSPRYLEKIYKKYDGTKKGRQELDAEMLAEVEGAFWTQAILDEWRVHMAPELQTIVVSVDPATTNSESSDECGIVAAGKAYDGHKYTIADRTMRGRPKAWAAEAVRLYHQLNANYIIAEVNQGGLMVQETIEREDPNVPVEMVHAARGKDARAEPVSMEYEQGLWHHVGVHRKLEDEMTTWTKDDKWSPNRIDALVWAAHALNSNIAEFGVTVI